MVHHQMHNLHAEQFGDSSFVNFLAAFQFDSGVLISSDTEFEETIINQLQFYKDTLSYTELLRLLEAARRFIELSRDEQIAYLEDSTELSAGFSYTPSRIDTYVSSPQIAPDASYRNAIIADYICYKTLQSENPDIQIPEYYS